jgi:hypothetical protein
MVGLSKFAFACAAAAMVAFTAPASAVTLVPGGPALALTAPNEYDYGPVNPAPGSVNDVFTFTYSGSGVATVTSVFTEVPPLSSGFTPDAYTISWVKIGLGTLVSIPIFLASTTTLLPLAGAGTYQFIINAPFEVGISSIGETITTTATPLPASLVLFGSALFGGVTLLRRRKRAVKAAA